MTRIFVSRAAASAALALLALFATCSQAQTQDRERAQMLQMQQQLQRLQSENAALQKDQAVLKQQAQDAERLKKESGQKSKELAQSQAETAARTKDLEGLRTELEKRDALIEQWKKAVEERDTALREASDTKHKLDGEVLLLAARLKAQTGRGDVCEAKHEKSLALGKEVIDRYEQNRLRLCEPVTGIWRVRDEDEIRRFRDRLYDARLDAVSPTAAK
jgi:chromosome segregation ATPase